MERVKNLLNISADLKKTVAETLSSEILDAAQKIQDRLEAGGKLMLMLIVGYSRSGIRSTGI